MGQLTAKQKTARHRDKLRRAGLRPIQVWALDTRAEGTAERLAAQCRALRDDPAEREIAAWAEAAAGPVEDWV
jgi:hypothetical protein